MRRHETDRDAVDEAFDELLRVALSEYVQKQKAFAERISTLPRWAIDNEALTLIFENDLGGRLTTSSVPVATYLPSKGSWAWVWANDGYSEQARIKASRLRELAELTGYKIFSSPTFRADRDEIDGLCALSLKHLGAQGIFKIKDEEPWQLVAVE